MLQSQFLAIGVPVEIQQLDSKAVMDATTQGDFELLLWRYEWNDPDALNVFLSSDRIGTTNRAGYSNAEVDDLLAQAAGELDEDKRNALYVEAQKIIMQDAPWQPLYNPVDAMAMSRRAEGITLGYMGRMLVNDAKAPNRPDRSARSHVRAHHSPAGGRSTCAVGRQLRHLPYAQRRARRPGAYPRWR